MKSKGTIRALLILSMAAMIACQSQAPSLATTTGPAASTTAPAMAFQFRRPPEARPIPSGPNARTAADFAESERKLTDRQVLQAYKTVGSRDPKWDAAAVALLQKVVESFPSPVTSALTEETAKLAQAAVDAGCDDAMVLFWHGVGQGALNRPQHAERYLHLARRKFPKSGYSPAYLAWSAGRLWETYNARNKSEKASRAKAELIDALPDAVGKGGFLPRERRVLLSYVDSVLKKLNLQERLDFCNAIEHAEGANAWVFHTAAGRVHVDLAWQARRCDWGHKVSHSGWKSFAEHLEVADRHLRQA